MYDKNVCTTWKKNNQRFEKMVPKHEWSLYTPERSKMWKSQEMAHTTANATPISKRRIFAHEWRTKNAPPHWKYISLIEYNMVFVCLARSVATIYGNCGNRCFSFSSAVAAVLCLSSWYARASVLALLFSYECLCLIKYTHSHAHQYSIILSIIIINTVLVWSIWYLPECTRIWLLKNEKEKDEKISMIFI